MKFRAQKMLYFTMQMFYDANMFGVFVSWQDLRKSVSSGGGRERKKREGQLNHAYFLRAHTLQYINVKLQVTRSQAATIQNTQADAADVNSSNDEF